MTLTITEAQARLHKLAAERPDYVYKEPDGVACVYFDKTGAPSCIVGHALEHELRAAGIDEYHPANDDNVNTFLFRSLLRLPTLVASYLAEAQLQQDNGVSWGRAVERADEALAAGYL